MKGSHVVATVGLIGVAIAACVAVWLRVGAFGTAGPGVAEGPVSPSDSPSTGPGRRLRANGQRTGEKPGNGSAGASHEKLDVLLVTVDTVRSDFVGAIGAAGAHTPNLDRLARTGTTYLNAWSPAPLTLPAHCSLMTGLDPPAHGVHDNGVSVLPAHIPTLAEAFAGAGYETAAFVASRVLDRRFGLDRGFRHYDDQMLAENRGEYGYAERSATEVTDAAMAWMRTARRPRFVWVHYYDPHAPYVPAKPWQGESTRERPFDRLRGAPSTGSEPAPDSIRGRTESTGSPDSRSAYAGEISAVDQELGRLLAALPDGAERSLIAVVGDHGESLGEHGERAHGLFLYRASLEVPLVISGGAASRGVAIGTLVSTRALARTLLELCGLGAAAGPFGAGLASSSDERPEPVYAETHMPANAYGWSPLRAVHDGRWRFIEAPRPELYDLVTDPRESRNAIGEGELHAARLRGRLDAVAQEAGALSGASPGADVDPELQASLRSLGYLGSASSGTPPETGAPIDPKDGIAMLAELDQAKLALEAGQPRQALSQLEELVRRSPGNVPFLTNLARAQTDLGDREGAIASFRRALERNPTLDFLELNLAEALFALQRVDEAREHYRRALALNPRLAGAWLGLAELEARSGRPVEEREALLEAVAAGTNSFGIYARLGQIELSAGKLDAADRALESATRLAPMVELGWILWSQVAEKQSRRPEALERALRAVEANGQHPIALLRAGRLLAEAGRAEEARPILAKAASLVPGTATGNEAQRLLSALRQ